MNVSPIDFISADDGRSVAERLQAYQEAKRQATAEYREKFAQFDIPESAPCPASLLFHRDSRFSPLVELPITEDEAAALTETLDYKRYPGRPILELPPATVLGVPLDEAIRRRRSTHIFEDRVLSIDELVQLLSLSAGVTCPGDVPRRPAPSAGALFPIELYAMLFRVEGIQVGLYHYAPLAHALEYVKVMGHPREIWHVLAPFFDGSTPSAVFLLTGRLSRVQAKYGERGYRFALIECGHIAQNMLLTATALGLNAVPIGGFFDDALNLLLGVDRDREPALYMVLVGGI